MKKFEEIQTHLQENLSKFEEIRQGIEDLRKKDKKYMIPILGLFVAMFASFITGPFVFVIFPILLYFTFKLVKKRKIAIEEPKVKLKESFKNEIILPFLEQLFGTVTYKYKPEIKETKIRSYKMYPNFNKISSEDYIKTKIGKTDLEMVELNLRHIESDGEDTVVKTIFKGLFIIADFHKDFKGTTRVVYKRKQSIFKKLFKSGSPDLMENPDFNKKFEVYSEDKVTSRYILSTNFIERILNTSKKYNCAIDILFHNSKMYLGIDWRMDMFEMDYETRVESVAAFRKFYEETTHIVNLIEELNQNRRIWGDKALIS